MLVHPADIAGQLQLPSMPNERGMNFTTVLALAFGRHGESEA